MSSLLMNTHTTTTTRTSTTSSSLEEEETSDSSVDDKQPAVHSHNNNKTKKKKQQPPKQHKSDDNNKKDNNNNNNDDDDDGNNNHHKSFHRQRTSMGERLQKAGGALVGTLSTLRQGRQEQRQQRRHVTYEPTHKWWDPPLSAWLPEHNREILVLLVLYNTAIPMIAYYTNFCGHTQNEDTGRIELDCGDDYTFMEDKILTGFAVGMFLLLAFRANQAYDRFWEGRKNWGRLREVSRDFTRLVCTHVEIETKDDFEDRRRIINFVTAFAVACKLQLRNEKDIQRDLKALGVDLPYQDVANIQQAPHMPLFCQDVMSDYLAKQYKGGRLTDYQMGVINETCLAVMSDRLGSNERLNNTPIPLSYVLQLRFFLMLWLLLYPLHIVAYYGWWSILLNNLISFAVLGIESMACEIENPFGYDRNDLDLDSYVEGFYKDTQAILSRAEFEDRDQIFDRSMVQSLSRSLHLEEEEFSKSLRMQMQQLGELDAALAAGATTPGHEEC